MQSLFSVFDPQSWFGLPLLWLTAALPLLLLSAPFWLAPSRSGGTTQALIRFVEKELRANIGLTSAPGTLLPLAAVFLYFFGINFFGLLPHVFTASTHLVLTFSLSLPFWLAPLLLALAGTPRVLSAHLVPLGSPTLLSPFIVLIELVSLLIRPLTLGVRMAANLIAGHLLMVLIRSSVFRLPSLIPCIVGGLIALVILESAVGAIQSFVFCLLLTLYSQEAESPSFRV